MKLSYIWSLFAKKDVPAKLYSNPKFEYLVSYETNDYDIIVKYYKIAGDSHILITKDNIPHNPYSVQCCKTTNGLNSTNQRQSVICIYNNQTYPVPAFIHKQQGLIANDVYNITIFRRFHSYTEPSNPDL